LKSHKRVGGFSKNRVGGVGDCTQPLLNFFRKDQRYEFLYQ